MTGPLLTIVLSALLQGTHPCDAAITPLINTKVPFSVGFCWTQKDVDGVAFTTSELAAMQVKVVIDGVLATTVALPSTGIGSATGKYYYEVPSITAAKGNRTVVVILNSGSEDSGPSPAYAFKVVGAPPAAGTNTQVKPKP